MYFNKHLIARSSILVSLVLTMPVHGIEVDKTASIKDTNTTIIGINHIAISVKDLDKVLDFYTQATGFEVIKRETVKDSVVADHLYGVKGVEYETATLKAPNMLFELTEFKHNEAIETTFMPAQGPGMTHTCFQSPQNNPGYNKFVAAGAKVLTRGDKPVDIGGYGVTYAYAYDPEGNMMELEQLDGQLLAHSGYNQAWSDQGYDIWMSQVALVTHDIDRLMGYYQQVLGFKPQRTGEYANNAKLDKIANFDGLALQGGWFRMNQKSKMMEFWQYKNPKTQQNTTIRQPGDLGYSFSLEVTDIQKEYRRLKALGVDFVSEPQLLGEFWQVFARDPDSNVYSLRQAVNPASTYSVHYFDPPDIGE